jgi:hypothetical protein
MQQADPESRPSKRAVECPEHGSQPATFVCQHIVQSLYEQQPVGFFPADDPDNPRPDAWCGACEARVQSAGGEWTDESETLAGVSLLCGACYDRAKSICRAAGG